MRYTGGLVKREREQIFKLFLGKEKLRFGEIEKALKIRSNMVSYHVERMQKEGLLEKRSLGYALTKKAERYIPIFPHVVGKELSPLPVVLVALVDNEKILLINRNKRPYKGYWAMVGGKMLLEEDFERASLRLVKEKAGLNAEFESVNAVMHERVEEEIIKYSFILFLTKARARGNTAKETAYGELKWFKLSGIEKERIVPSDLWLIKNRLSSKIDVKGCYMKDDGGELRGFRLLGQ